MEDVIVAGLILRVEGENYSVNCLVVGMLLWDLPGSGQGLDHRLRVIVGDPHSVVLREGQHSLNLEPLKPFAIPNSIERTFGYGTCSLALSFNNYKINQILLVQIPK